MTRTYTNLGLAMYYYLQCRGLKGKEIAKEVGISASSLSRLMNGKTLDGHSLTKLMVWLTSNAR